MRRCEARSLPTWWPRLALVALAVLQASPSRAEEAPIVPSLLRLSDAMEIALRGSTQLGVAQAQLDATRKQRLNALFNLGPDLSVSAGRSSATRTDFDLARQAIIYTDTIVTLGGRKIPYPVQQSLDPADRTEESSFRQYEVATRVRLFDGFANLARYSAAGHDVRSTQYDLAYTRKLVQQSVIAAYYNLLRAQMLLKVTQEAEAVAREQLDRTQAMYELGSAARSDVLKSQVQLGQTRLTTVQAENGVRQARVNLEYAMNLSTTTPFEIDSTVAQVGDEPVDYEAERGFALGNRENLLSLRASEKAAGRRALAAGGALWPTLDFQYSMGQSRSSSQFRFGAAENRSRSWAFSANWNLWDRYLNYSNLGQARASARIAEYNRRQAELDAVREIRTLVNDIAEARERLGVSRENVARSQEDLRLAQEKFRVGAGTILDTITAESDLTSTKANVVQAIVDYLIARANLARATGRPFSGL